MTGETLLILNGPDLAGSGGPGNPSLKEIENACRERCDTLGLALDFRAVEDGERALQFIAGKIDRYDALIVNPAESRAQTPDDTESCRAAIEALAHQGKPVIEVHVENIFRSEDERGRPLQAAESGLGLVCGLGVSGYLLAIEAVCGQLKARAA